MAKGTGISGLFSGKKGDGVFYVIGNAKSSAERQGWRQYQPRVKNPQTYAQAFQRMKMLPMIDCYNNLAPIIRRGFEGVPYGARSLMRYQQVNLSMENGFPYIAKNARDICPGAYQISEGSLPEIVITDLNVGTSKIARCNILLDKTAASASGVTVGQFDQNIINSNTNIQNGDQLTFVYVVTAEAAFYYRTFSIVLDTSDTTPLLQSGSRIWHGLRIAWTNLDTPLNFLEFSMSLMEDELVAAAGIIQSRDGDKVNLRSSATLKVDVGACSRWYSEEAYNEAIASYMTGDAGTRSDWPVEPIRGLRGNLVLTNLGSSVTNPAGGAQCLAWQGDDDFYILYIPSGADGKQLVGANGVGLTYGDDPILYVGSGVSTMEYNAARMGHL